MASCATQQLGVLGADAAHQRIDGRGQSAGLQLIRAELAQGEVLVVEGAV
jgi:hypothetical protein